MGALLGSIVSALMASSAQNNANQVNMANLNETKRENSFRDALATSSQEDGFGNKIVYDPNAKAWHIVETPITSGILGAQQNEQYKELTQDAPANRADAQARDRRAKMGADAFEQAFNEYRYRPRKSEANYEGEAIRDSLSARKSSLDQVAGIIANQLLRTGNTSNYGSVLKTVGDQYAKGVDDSIAQGRARGRQAYQQDQTDNPDLTDLQYYQRVADDTPSRPVQQSDLGSSLGNMQSGAISQLLSAIGQDQSAYSSASGQLAAGLGRSPSLDLSGIDTLMSSMTKGAKNPAVPTTASVGAPNMYENWMMQSGLGSLL